MPCTDGVERPLDACEVGRCFRYVKAYNKVVSTNLFDEVFEGLIVHQPLMQTLSATTHCEEIWTEPFVAL